MDGKKKNYKIGCEKYNFYNWQRFKNRQTKIFPEIKKSFEIVNCGGDKIENSRTFRLTNEHSKRKGSGNQ